MSLSERMLHIRLSLQDHKDCASDYNTHEYVAVRNSPLAEQKNSIIRGLEGVISNMTQPNAMNYLQWYLAEMNEQQRARNDGKCWWDRTRKSVR